MMKKETLFTFVIISIALGSATVYIPCQKNVDPDSVEIADCVESPCTIIRSKNISLVMHFTPKEHTDALLHHVVLTVKQIRTVRSIPYPKISGTDACPFIYDLHGSHVGCPIEANKQYVYKNEFAPTLYIPKILGTIELSLHDLGRRRVCFMMDLVTLA